jgi:cysteinyl-tRNA synthetase
VKSGSGSENEFFYYLLNTVLEFRQKCRECGAYKTSDRIRDKFQELGFGNLIRDKKGKNNG